MVGAHIDNIKKVNLAVNSVKNKARVYENIVKLNNKSLKTPIRDLMHSSAPGKKISKIGFALFWIPEPTMISNAIALPLMGAGKLLDRYYTGTTIKHVNEEARRTLNLLQDFFR
ncbi:MAG: hypothetical protein QXU32_08675 [Nitrososphaerales archaeon]